jgi:glycosyltransferase involved in cell wall biosynthesis
MKILLVHNFYQQPGGEDRVFSTEGTLLEKRGHQVLRYTVHNRDTADYGRIALLQNTLWNQQVYRDIRSLIKKEHPEVIHFHNTFPLISPSAYYAAKKERVPVVQTLHNYRLLCSAAILYRDGHPCEHCIGKKVPWPGVYYECYKESVVFSAGVAAMLTLHRSIRTWDKAVTSYIVMTEFARNKFIDGGLPAARITVKPHFLDPDPGVGKGEGNYALFVGRLSSEKGVETLLNAWEELGHTLQLKIVGDGPLATRVNQSLYKNSSIEWLGSKSPQEVYALMGDATCLIFPSQWYETFGLVVIEAFARGTPVIASRIGGIEEIVEHAKTGLFFTPGDHHDLARQILWLKNNPRQMSEMRREARTRFLTKYSSPCNYEKLIAIYQDAMGHCSNS